MPSCASVGDGGQVLRDLDLALPAVFGTADEVKDRAHRAIDQTKTTARESSRCGRSRCTVQSWQRLPALFSIWVGIPTQGDHASLETLRRLRARCAQSNDTGQIAGAPHPSFSIAHGSPRTSGSMLSVPLAGGCYPAFPRRGEAGPQ